MTLGLPDLYRGESMRLYHLLFAVLTILLSGALSPAHAEWQEASSRPFLVYGDVSARQVRAYAERLERYDSAMRFITGPAPPAAPGSSTTLGGGEVCVGACC